MIVRRLTPVRGQIADGTAYRARREDPADSCLTCHAWSPAVPRISGVPADEAIPLL
jgi:hypothetical protein